MAARVIAKNGRALGRGGLAVVASFLLVPVQFFVYAAGEWDNAALWTRATVRSGDMALALGVQAAVVALPVALLWKSAGSRRSLVVSLLGVAAILVVRAVLARFPALAGLGSAMVDISQFVAVPIAAASLAGWAVALLWGGE